MDYKLHKKQLPRIDMSTHSTLCRTISKLGAFTSLLTALLLNVLPCRPLSVCYAKESPSKAASSRSVESQADEPLKKAPLEKILYRVGGNEEAISGKLVIEAADGGLLLEARDGTLVMIEGSEVLGRTPSDQAFTSLSKEEISEQLLVEFPVGFRVHTTPHYVVCYNTSREFAQWTSSLLERLYKAFTNYWESQGLEITEPEFPLVVMVFADRQSYDKASREDLPKGTGNIVGFYSLRSNRVNMFDLSGLEALRADGRRGSMREINQMLSQPAAVPLVATIVHEATHQIAFNCGLQQRYADIPLWLCEGMAVYFEAPDLSNTRGWRGIGRINYPRLTTFRENLPNWRTGDLERLITTNDNFRNPETAIDSYANAWALNYYLIKYKPKKYLAYLKALAEKQPLVDDKPKERLELFTEHFGNPQTLEQEFLKQMSRIK